MRQTTKRVTSEKIISQIKTASDLFNKRLFEESIQVYKQLLEQVDDYYAYDKCEIYRCLGNCYYYLKDYDNAIWAYENTLRFFTNNGSIYNMLGFLYFYKDSDKSIQNYLEGMRFKPDLKNYVMLTQVMTKSHSYTQKELKNTFEKFVDIFRPVILKDSKPFKYCPADYDSNKRLRIGYLSSDFHCHAMMSFVLPIIENHDLGKYDFYLYSVGQKKDYVTDRIKNTGVIFREYSQLNNEDLAKAIHADKIDILIDLSGYTHNAIWSLLYKPAPVIGQYLGFLGTYGMKEVDFIIADKFTIPEEMAKYYTETPLYIEPCMNRFTFNTINQKLPDITPLPYEENKYITFGSFNCMSKINPYTVGLWSKVLKAVPSSKLLIYRTQMQERDIIRYKRQFSEYGVADERLIFDNKPTPINHFTSYLKCDIALDPSPFSGLTLTIEQAHMGVPVLTLPYETISAKGTARVNKAIGLEDFVATDEQDYVNKAVAIASDIEKLRWLRQNLRTMVSQSILCNGFKEYTQAIETGYEKIWHDYCSGNL